VLNVKVAVEDCKFLVDIVVIDIPDFPVTLADLFWPLYNPGST